MIVKVKKLHPDAVIPNYATPGSAGFDLVSVGTVILKPGQRAVVFTGLSMEIPEGYELQIRPRSGISLNTNLRVANSPGTVDSDYRGEIGVIVENTALDYTHQSESDVHPALNIKGTEDDEILCGFPQNTYIIRKGDRIAQGVIVPVIQAEFEETDELSETERGSGGFGSTGTR